MATTSQARSRPLWIVYLLSQHLPAEITETGDAEAEPSQVLLSQGWLDSQDRLLSESAFLLHSNKDTKGSHGRTDKADPA